jgi:hypothetical protein
MSYKRRSYKNNMNESYEREQYIVTKKSRKNDMGDVVFDAKEKDSNVFPKNNGLPKNNVLPKYPDITVENNAKTYFNNISSESPTLDKVKIRNKNIELFVENEKNEIIQNFDDEYPVFDDELQKMYKNSPITTLAGCHILNSFRSENTINDKLFNKLLTIINEFLPLINNLPKNLNALLKIIGLKNKVTSNIKNFCGVKKCPGILNDNFFCNFPRCEFNETVSKNYSSFYAVPVKERIEKSVSHFYKDILSYSRSDNDFIDILDGEYYNEINREQSTVNLMIYSDGVQLSKSKINKHCWPVFLSIVELPLQLRDSKKNKIIAGCYFGSKKPSSDWLFSFLVDELKKLSNPFQIKIDEKILYFNLNVYGLICDSPAKNMIINTIQFNGICGCPYCLNPGFRLDSRNIYEGEYPDRTAEDYKIDYQKGNKQKSEILDPLYICKKIVKC